MNPFTKMMERISRRRLAYRRTFLNANGDLHNDADIVLADLKRFCRATASTATVSPITKAVDPIAMAMAEGRREVWMRIQAHLELTDRIVFNLTEPEEQ